VNVSSQSLDELLRVSPADWLPEMEETKQFIDKFGARLPREIREEHEKLVHRFQRAVTA
jgi:GTP-dependent phosphoenolpyruvate carboxykinase